MKKSLYLISSFLFFLVVLYTITGFNTKSEAHTNQINNKESIAVVDTFITVTIGATGDLMCHSTQFNYAAVGADSFDFHPVYKYMKPYYDMADIMFGNFETVTAGKSVGFSGYPRFNTPDEFIIALKNSGFDFVTTSNNHAFDQDEKGVLRTIEKLTENGIDYVGTATSQRDRDSIRIFNVKDVSIAVLAYSYSTNGRALPKGKDYLVNLIDTVLIREDITRAKKLDPDLVLVYFHFGSEYQREPNAYQKQVVKRTISAGADLIIGSHPHVIQPIDYFKTENANLDTGFVAWSLGNAVSNQRKRYRDAGMNLYIDITKNTITDSIFISDVRVLPTYVFKGRVDGETEYHILPSEYNENDSTLSFLSPNDINKMTQADKDSKEILKKYTQNFSLISPSN